MVRTAIFVLGEARSGLLLSGLLLIGVVAVSVAGAVLPYARLGALLGFTSLPLSLLGAISLLAITYLFLVQAVKTWFYRQHALL